MIVRHIEYMFFPSKALWHVKCIHLCMQYCNLEHGIYDLFTCNRAIGQIEDVHVCVQLGNPACRTCSFFAYSLEIRHVETNICVGMFLAIGQSCMHIDKISFYVQCGNRAYRVNAFCLAVSQSGIQNVCRFVRSGAFGEIQHIEYMHVHA